MEIEDAVASFVDEEIDFRREIPESSDSEEEEDDLALRKRRMRRDGQVDKLALGATFWSGYEFKEAVLDYALTNAKNIEQNRWDKTKIGYKCGEGGKCEWRLYCSYDEPQGKWVIKTKCGYHSCNPKGRCKMLKAPVIAKLFLHKLRQKPNFWPVKMQKYIKETWRLQSTTDQCQNGRLLALKWLEREYEQQFAHIRGYVEEIRTHHEKTPAIVETYPNAKKQDVFSRFYVCFEKLRTRWKSSCRPIIGVDGTFFKGIVKGVLLTAVGHDPNNQIYPIAWAVVQAETGDNWLWFLKNLKADLGLEDGSGYVIISDRCKGLLTSVKAELPNAEHRFCVKHICENLKKNHAGKDLLKKYVWNVAWSCNMPAYRKNLQKLKEYDVPLFEDVLRMEPRNWTLAFFKLGSFCDKVENNSTESFNGTITKARGKAIIPMLETIRRQAMVRNAKRQKKAERWDGRCTKYVKLVLAELKEHADKCVVTRGSHGHFEVDLYDDRCHVDMQKKTCSCFKWQISGIPCEHAYGAMLDAGLDTDDYVYECFSTAKQRDCYSDNVDPMRGPHFWMAGSHRLVVPPPEQDPPEGTEKKKEKKSKKGKKRIKGKFESPKKKKRQVQKTKRTGRIMHCSKCGEVGHNAATCEIHPKKKRKMTDEASDQANASSQGAGHGAFQGPETMSLTQPSQMSE